MHSLVHSARLNVLVSLYFLAFVHVTDNHMDGKVVLLLLELSRSARDVQACFWMAIFLQSLAPAPNQTPELGMVWDKLQPISAGR